MNEEETDTPTSITIKEEEVQLIPEKAVFWPRKSMLLLADLHLGKIGHFRREGVGVPAAAGSKNLERMEKLIHNYAPEHLVVLGDLFHSAPNYEWHEFIQWKKTHLDAPQIRFTLVKGNHDWGTPFFHGTEEIEITKQLIIPPFLFVHDVDTVELASEKNPPSNDTLYPIGGHVHPAVQMKGKGRQYEKPPCFYFGVHHALIPAFGTFTGTHIIKPGRDDLVYVSADNEILKVS